MNTFPVGWLLHFSRIFHVSVVQKLMLSRSLRRGLTSNGCWKERSKNIPFFGTLTKYEQDQKPQTDDFWYRWYIHHFPFPFLVNLNTVWVRFPNENMPCEIPQKGNIVYIQSSGKRQYYVVTQVIGSQKRPFKFLISKTKYTGQDKCYAAKIDEESVTVRKNGNLSVPVQKFRRGDPYE